MTAVPVGALALAPSTCAPHITSTRRRLPWAPASVGRYRLPREIEGRLVAAVSDLRNREAVYALAVFLGRFHSAAGRLERPFAVCREALADHPELGLTEARVRGALAVLEMVGFLVREPMPGSAYRATECGLRRKPVQLRFGPEWLPDFRRANARAERTKGGGQASRRGSHQPAAQCRQRPPYRILCGPNACSPEKTSSRVAICILASSGTCARRSRPIQGSRLRSTGC